MIELPILWKEKEDCQLHDLGIETQQDYENTRMMTFYSIVAISPYEEDGREMTEIHTNGTGFITTIPYRKMKDLVHNVLYK